MERFTAGEKADLVVAYRGVPHGKRMAWLAEHGINPHAMGRWRKAYYYGDLERELVPRDTAGMNQDDGARTRQLEQELAQERVDRLREQREHAAEVARLQAMNEALGKAIGLLHDRSAGRGPIDEF